MVVANWLMSETTEIINKAARLAEELGVSPPAVVLYHRFLHHTGSSNHKEALRVIALFSKEAGPELQTRAESCIATSIHMSGGSLETALAHSAKALSGYDRKRHSKQRFQFTYEPRCVALSVESLELTLRGYFDRAKAVEREALDYAAEFAHPQTTGHVLAYKLLRGEFQQDHTEQEETQAALSRHTEEHKIVFWSLWADIFRGFAAARAGRAQEGIAMIDHSLTVFAEMRFTYYRAYHLGLKARAYQIAGDNENALVSANEAIGFANDSEEKVVLADLMRLSGDLHLAQFGAAAAATAEGLFSEAIALARAQASKLHELRAATSMARLLRKQFKHDDAENLLQPVYDWFTEGYEAPDLADARAVLHELSADLRHENA